jgi:hypothetical protein
VQHAAWRSRHRQRRIEEEATRGWREGGKASGAGDARRMECRRGQGAPAPALRGSLVQGGREPRGGGWGLNDTSMWVSLMVVDLGDAV